MMMCATQALWDSMNEIGTKLTHDYLLKHKIHQDSHVSQLMISCAPEIINCHTWSSKCASNLNF